MIADVAPDHPRPQTVHRPPRGGDQAEYFARLRFAVQGARQGVHLPANAGDAMDQPFLLADGMRHLGQYTPQAYIPGWAIGSLRSFYASGARLRLTPPDGRSDNACQNESRSNSSPALPTDTTTWRNGRSRPHGRSPQRVAVTEDRPTEDPPTEERPTMMRTFGNSVLGVCAVAAMMAVSRPTVAAQSTP